MKIKYTQGFMSVGLGIVVVLIVAGVWYVTSIRSTEELRETSKEESNMKDTEGVMEEGGAMLVPEENNEGAMVEGEMIVDAHGFTGVQLAGNKKTPLLDFTQADYEKAVEGDALIAFYFYANWCPTCRLEFPRMQEVFNELEGENVIGFRVNFNDSDTDSDEKALAKKFGVAYQHTKVFVKNGERILKSPESWSADRYRSEINSNL